MEMKPARDINISAKLKVPGSHRAVYKRAKPPAVVIRKVGMKDDGPVKKKQKVRDSCPLGLLTLGGTRSYSMAKVNFRELHLAM